MGNGVNGPSRGELVEAVATGRYLVTGGAGFIGIRR
jgi:hypothetical protein